MFIPSFIRTLCSLILVTLLVSCTASEDKAPLFSTVPLERSGIDFENNLTFNEEFNIYRYRNFYNGGGVGLGDVNNDGLMDVYLTANMGPNKLFLNKGNF
ncbi:MAG: hypothetical protein GVY20_01725, partial [Bacteroidetes bacterium]|nr:hypothetical protein [Bacteroidota bacterium]